jgi:carbon monoxide dehydrogenase subunit G
MKPENSFEVPAPPEQAWDLLYIVTGVTLSGAVAQYGLIFKRRTS